MNHDLFFTKRMYISKAGLTMPIYIASKSVLGRMEGWLTTSAEVRAELFNN